MQSMRLNAEQFLEPCYKNYFAGEKWKYTVILDEARIRLNDCDKEMSIYYRKQREKNLQTSGSINAKKFLVKGAR